MSSPNKSIVQTGRAKSPTKATLIKQQLEHDMTLEDRMSLMRQDSKVTGDDMAEYKRTELLRKSVNDVKVRAAADAKRRQSPMKTMSGVKSKIAGNMRSQKKAKKMGKLSDEQKYHHQQVLAGDMTVLSDGRLVGTQRMSAARVAEMSPERTAEIVRKQNEILNLKSEFEERRNVNSTFKAQETTQTRTNVRDFSPEETANVAWPSATQQTTYTVHEEVHQKEDDEAEEVDAGIRTYKASPTKGKKAKKSKKAAPQQTGYQYVSKGNFDPEELTGITALKQTGYKNVSKGNFDTEELTGITSQSNITQVRYTSPVRQSAVGPAPIDRARARVGQQTQFTGNANLFRNEEYEAKIAGIQAEFQALLKQPKPQYKTVIGDTVIEMDRFYQVMGEFYDHDMPKHASPTRRLMDQQKATWAHKSHLHNKVKRGEISMKDYSLTYTVDPKNTYVIQPTQGEINYDLAAKSPLKFYNNVMNQDVVEHKIGRSDGAASDSHYKAIRKMTMTSRMTKRHVGQILIAVQNKLYALIGEATRNQFDAKLLEEALAHPKTQGVVYRHIAGKNIGLVDTRGHRVFKAHMSMIGEKGQRAGNESPDARRQRQFAEAADASIDIEEARLDADPVAVQEVTDTVTGLIRAQSLKSQQTGI